jgi:hypothetical protein
MLWSMRPLLWIALSLVAFAPLASPQAGEPSPSTYLGFDRNDYPGDAALPVLRKTFSYTGYWLNNPPGARVNTWKGKRQIVDAAGFGFLVLFNGRLYAELKKVREPADLGKSDGLATVAAARKEGFPDRTIIFLDQEQGGRMLPEQRGYIEAWVDAVNANGYRAGVYCSGIPAKEEGGRTVITAENILGLTDNRDVTFWVTNDACPPSPGCSFDKPPSVKETGLRFVDVWQFAQSPKRPDVAAGCPANYNRDGSCYAPGFPSSRPLHVDLDSATSPDPSNGRSN